MPSEGDSLKDKRVSGGSKVSPSEAWSEMERGTRTRHRALTRKREEGKREPKPKEGKRRRAEMSRLDTEYKTAMSSIERSMGRESALAYRTEPCSDRQFNGTCSKGASCPYYNIASGHLPTCQGYLRAHCENSHCYNVHPVGFEGAALAKK